LESACENLHWRQVKLPAVQNGEPRLECGRVPISTGKSAFYEQVTDVNLFFLDWSFCFCWCSLRRPLLSTVFLFALLTSLSRSRLGAGWGSREESMLPFLARS
jgi:hypothetical protein